MTALPAFEDFSGTGPAGPHINLAGGEMSSPAGEAERLAAWEQGYKAGWDDAVRAEAEEQTRIGAEFARTLQEISFTFHEARAQVLQAIEPVLQEIAATLLPGLGGEAFAGCVMGELHAAIARSAGSGIELVVSPAGRAALEAHLPGGLPPGVEIAEEGTLSDSQAWVRVAGAERHIDLATATERIREAVAGTFAGALQKEEIADHG